MDKIVRTVCQRCHCECGVLVHVHDNQIMKIEGDPNHPMSKGFICIKGRTYHHYGYHPDRLKYPFKRAGRRGDGKWERVSWDEVLDAIAAKLTEIKDKYGPEAFVTMHGDGPRPTQPGTCLLAYALGSPNYISDNTHICYLPTYVAGHVTMGDSLVMDVGPDYLNANCIMVIGGNPLASHPVWGVQILEAQRNRGAKLIVIDPHRIELAAKADLWLQIRPGTDAAFMMGMIGIIIEEKLHDKEFVDTWCVGFDELAQRAREYPVEKVAEITWLNPDDIRQAARLFATTKPATLHQRVAIEHNINSTQTSRAVHILMALAGNIDVPGGNVFPVSVPGYLSLHSLWAGEGIRPGREIEQKRLGAEEYPLVAGPDAVAPLVPAPIAHDALRYGKPYPIRAMFCAGANIVLNMQNAKSVWNQLRDNTEFELFVVTDLFMTPTAELADYVLPAATWLERDETCDVMCNDYIAARQKVIEPPGECWHDMKITIELVRRLPWANRKAVPWDTIDEFNEALLKETGLTFEELKEKGYVVVPMKYRKYQKNGFETPSGKVELYSSIFKKYGYDPLPFYVEPPESPVSTPVLLKDYPLILYTGGKHIEYFHSEGRQISALRKRVPDPLVEIHPETGGQMNISDGDWVWIETPQIKNERVRFKAKLTDAVHPKMAHARHCWWFPEKPGPEHGCFDSNINVVLTDDPPRENISCSVRTRGTLCRIYK